MDSCIICNEPTSCSEKQILTEKGSNSLNNACKERQGNLSSKPGDVVHQTCRRNYTDKRRILQAKRKHSSDNDFKFVDLRSTNAFDFRKHCLFCCKLVKVDKSKRGCDVFPVRTMDFQSKILQVCFERNDSWANQVRGRINSVNDLHAADAMYHQTCSVNFRTMKQIPALSSFEEPSTKRRSLGRPMKDTCKAAFEETMKFFEENDDEQITVHELVRKMSEYCDDPFSIIHMRQKLNERYGQNIIITSINGKTDVVTFRFTARNILHEFFKDSKNGEADSRDAILKAAAKIVRSDIKSMNISKQEYPTPSEIESLQRNLTFIPDGLKTLLQAIFSEDKPQLKIASIGQAIIQAVRPRVIIAPLQLSLSVQLHQQFASKYLIDTLNKLGFCSSYNEVQKFESCAALVQGNSISDLPPESCLQFIADNVDHNSNTIDGHNTFHGMGIMSTVTPGFFNDKCILRVDVSRESILNLGTVDIKIYRKRLEMQEIKFEELQSLKHVDKYYNLDVLSLIIKPLKSPTPSWSGFMQMVHKGDHLGKTSMLFFPMIDMEPGDMSCIYSTLLFVTREAEKYSRAPIVTFDQPLYWKALTIIRNESADRLKNVVLRLGGFHLQMSFLGSVGHLMAGSGLEEVLETVYASNAVKHMLTGKAVSRALRGHFLVEAALSTILVKKAFGLIEENSENFQRNQGIEIDSNKDLNEVREIYCELSKGNISIDDAVQSNVFGRIESRLSEFKELLSDCRTAQLWFQYLNTIDLVHKFIRSERTGDWLLHLDTIQRMLPYFAASGHNMYLKSAFMYLVDMQKLPSSHPDIYESFLSGKHVVRRSDRLWAGIWTDLTIEQVLMRSLKTSGGLTRGRGITEYQRTMWVLSSPMCAEFSLAMQNLTETLYTTSEQHKDTSVSRMNRDTNDLMRILTYLEQRDPFQEGLKDLRGLHDGVTAESNVNVDMSLEIGRHIIHSMVGKDAMKHVFKRKNHAITLASKHSIKIDNEECITVDPQLMFQRLTAIAKDSYPDLSEVFRYELTSIPPALFDSSGLLREASKSQLADAIWSTGDCGDDDESLSKCGAFVLDGGSLIHRFTWQQKSTFEQITIMYVQYVINKFPNACVVFDGYNYTPSTKDLTHQRRSKGIRSRKTIFNESTVCTTKREHFLSNKENKMKFIQMLSTKLLEAGCEVVQTDADADPTLVFTALQKARNQSVALVGEDTDLLILMLYHLESNIEHQLYFYSDKQMKNHRIWNICKTREILGFNLCKCLLVMHALTGCDTTSRLFGISKQVTLKKIKANQQFYLNAIMPFLDKSSSITQLEQAGEEILASLYGALPGEGLDVLRFRKFVTKMSMLEKHIDVQSLPPTSESAKQHIFRSYHQIQQWIANDLDATKWGWKLNGNGYFQPIKTMLAPAPSDLLKIIRCNCKTNCDSQRCSCRRHGIKCSICCGECRGTSCTNAEPCHDDEDN